MHQLQWNYLNILNTLVQPMEFNPPPPPPPPRVQGLKQNDP